MLVLFPYQFLLLQKPPPFPFHPKLDAIFEQKDAEEEEEMRALEPSPWTLKATFEDVLRAMERDLREKDSYEARKEEWFAFLDKRDKEAKKGKKGKKGGR